MRNDTSDEFKELFAGKNSHKLFVGAPSLAETVIIIVSLIVLFVTITAFFFVRFLPDIQGPGRNAGHHIARQVTVPVNVANNVAVQNDVHNAVLAVNTYVASNPQATDLSAVQVVSSQATIHLQVTGTPAAYMVTGTDSVTGYTYAYNSQTGQYNIVSAGR